MRRSLLAVSAALLVSLAASAAASAMPMSAVPPDLTRLLAAWSTLKARQLVATVAFVGDSDGKAEHVRSVMAATDAPAREQLVATDDGTTVAIRQFPEGVYASAPSHGGRWLSATNAELANGLPTGFRFTPLGQPVASLEQSLRQGIGRWLAYATGVQEVGADTVAGQPTTRFVFDSSGYGPTPMDFASDGQLVRAVIHAAHGTSTVDLSTTTAVRVRRPPSARTTAVGQLPAHQRAKVKGELFDDLLTPGLAASSVLELL